MRSADDTSLVLVKTRVRVCGVRAPLKCPPDAEISLMARERRLLEAERRCSSEKVELGRQNLARAAETDSIFWISKGFTPEIRQLIVHSTRFVPESIY